MLVLIYFPYNAVFNKPPAAPGINGSICLKNLLELETSLLYHGIHITYLYSIQ